MRKNTNSFARPNLITNKKYSFNDRFGNSFNDGNKIRFPIFKRISNNPLIQKNFIQNPNKYNKNYISFSLPNPQHISFPFNVPPTFCENLRSFKSGYMLRFFTHKKMFFYEKNYSDSLKMNLESSEKPKQILNCIEPCSEIKKLDILNENLITLLRKIKSIPLL